jgi:hypothetical protein
LRRGDLGVREKALWRFLYKIAARATEALSINVEDLDLDNKRVRVRSKGGDTDSLYFSDRLRAAAPTADRRVRAWAAVPRRSRPRCRPRTSRRRSLPRHRPRQPFLPACRGAVLRGLRRVDAASALPLGTYPPGRAEREPAAADGQEPPHQPVVVAVLRPAGAEAVAALTAATDPARRRRYPSPLREHPIDRTRAADPNPQPALARHGRPMLDVSRSVQRDARPGFEVREPTRPDRSCARAPRRPRCG